MKEQNYTYTFSGSVNGKFIGKFKNHEARLEELYGIKTDPESLEKLKVKNIKKTPEKLTPLF